MGTNYVGHKMSRKERRQLQTGSWQTLDCERKKRYSTEVEAVENEAMHPGKLMYPCQWCNGFHFGRKFEKR